MAGLTKIYFGVVFTLCIVCSCQSDSNNETNDKTNESVIMNEINEKNESQEQHKEWWVISEDSTWKLRIYPKVGIIFLKTRKILYPIISIPKRFICVEAKPLDTNKSIEELLPPAIPLEPRATPPSLRTAFIYDTIYSMKSTIEITTEGEKIYTEPITEDEKLYSVQFAFSIDAFQFFKNEIQIKLCYSGGYLVYGPDPIYFNVKNINQLIMPLDSGKYDANAPLADIKWFMENHLGHYVPKKQSL